MLRLAFSLVLVAAGCSSGESVDQATNPRTAVVNPVRQSATRPAPSAELLEAIAELRKSGYYPPSPQEEDQPEYRYQASDEEVRLEAESIEAFQKAISQSEAFSDIAISMRANVNRDMLVVTVDDQWHGGTVPDRTRRFANLHSTSLSSAKVGTRLFGQLRVNAQDGTTVAEASYATNGKPWVNTTYVAPTDEEKRRVRAAAAIQRLKEEQKRLLVFAETIGDVSWDDEGCRLKVVCEEAFQSLDTESRVFLTESFLRLWESHFDESSRVTIVDSSGESLGGVAWEAGELHSWAVEDGWTSTEAEERQRQQVAAAEQQRREKAEAERRKGN